MKKKLTIIMLAIVMCVSGALLAIGCSGGGNNNNNNAVPAEYSVTFYGEDGITELEHQTVTGGHTASADNIRVTQKAGYTVVWVDANGNAYDFSSAVNGNLSLILSYKANEVGYKVEYYGENLNGDGYSVIDEDELTGLTDSAVTVSATEITGFTYDADNSGNVTGGTVAGDGSLVLKLYYTRNEYTVKFMTGETEFDSVTAKYGATVTAPEGEVEAIDKTPTTMKKFTYWSASVDGAEYNFATEISGSLTLYAVYEEVGREYGVTLSDGQGLYTYRDTDNAILSSGYVDAESNYVFTVRKSNEAEGEAVVSYVTVDDNGEKSDPVTLTAVDGVYTIENVVFDVEISVSGLTQIVYTVSIDIVEAPYPDDVAWAKPYGDIKEEIVARIKNYAKPDEYLYQAGVVNGSTAVLTDLPAGEYVVDFVIIDDDNQTIVVGDSAVEFTVNYREAEDKVLYADGTVGYGAPSVTFHTIGTQTNGDNFTMEGGVITGEIVNKDGGHLDATIDGFNPENNDFIATVTFEENGEILESDPMFGYQVIGKEGTHFFASFNRAGLRFRAANVSQSDVSNILGTGNMLAKATDGYDKVTYTLVRKGGTFYVFLTGSEKNGAVNAVTNKLMCVLSEDGVFCANGHSMAKGTAYPNAVAGVVNEGIDTLHIVLQMTNDAPIKVYGIGYSYDADLIDSYLADIKSTVNVDANGEQESYVIDAGEVKEIELVLPEGKIVDSITCNGDAVIPEISINEESRVVAKFSVTAGFSSSVYSVVATYKDGSLVAIKGTVTSPVDVTLTVDGAPVSVDNGEFETFVAPGAEYYLVRAEANGYKTFVKKVTDTTEAVEVVIADKWQATADGVMIGDIAFTGHTGPGVIEGATKTSWVRDVDDEGNEIVKQVPGVSTARQAILYNYSGSRFVAEYTIKYDVTPDGYIRIGFVVGHGTGEVGHIGVYGREWSSINNPGWANKPAMSSLPGSNSPLGGKYVGAGEFTVKMIYDNGNIALYLKNKWMFGDDQFYLYYAGPMIYAGGEAKAIPGDVVVGICETSSPTPTCTVSNIKISDLPEIELPSGDGYTTEIRYQEGKPVLAITLDNYGEGGKEVSSAKLNGKAISLSLDPATGVYTSPIDISVVLEGATVEVVVEDYRARTAFGGTVTLKGNALAGATVTMVGEDGIEYVATTGADGKWSTEAPLDDYTVTYIYAGAFEKQVDVKETDAITALTADLVAGFGATIGDKTTNANVVFNYDKKAENPWDSLEIYQPARNLYITWNEIAPYSTWGFTLNMPKNISLRDNGTYYDQDIYLKWYVYDGAEKNIGINSAGEPWGGTRVYDGNVFKDMFGNLNFKDITTAGETCPIYVRYVRAGATVTMYIKLDEFDSWVEFSKVEVSSATDAIGYYTFSAARSDGYNTEFTYTNLYYLEGSADDKTAVTVKQVEHATVEVDKTEAGMNEAIKVSMQADEGYAITNVLVNGKPAFYDLVCVIETNGEILVPAMSCDIYANAYEDYEISAKVVSIADFKPVTGNITYAQDGYEDIYGKANASLVFTAEDGTVYSGQSISGEYATRMPAGTYSAYAEASNMKSEPVTVTVDEDGTVQDFVLSLPTAGFWDLHGGSLVPTSDGGLSWKYWGSTQETAVKGVTFTPSTQILEFGYTISGMFEQSQYPHLGMFIKSDANHIGRLVFNGAGDTMILMAQNDYSSRYSLWDSENWGFFGWKCNLDSNGNKVDGVDDCYTWQSAKWYNKEMPYELSVKFVWDGYTFQMWAQTGLMKKVAPNEWSHITDGYNIYDRYANSDTMAQYAATLYELDKPCQFGISARLDTAVDGPNTPKFTNIWYKVYDKPVA